MKEFYEYPKSSAWFWWINVVLSIGIAFAFPYGWILIVGEIGFMLIGIRLTINELNHLMWRSKNNEYVLAMRGFRVFLRMILMLPIARFMADRAGLYTLAALLDD